MIVLFIKGLKAIGKGRPRFNFYTKTTYTPEKTRIYEKRIREEFWKQYSLSDCYQEEPIECRIRALYSIPKSYSKRKKLDLIGKPYEHKPDCDNIAKAILDALNNLAYRDDNQIIKLSVEKFYTDEEDSIEITIGGLDELL